MADYLRRFQGAAMPHAEAVRSVPDEALQFGGDAMRVVLERGPDGMALPNNAAQQDAGRD